MVVCFFPPPLFVHLLCVHSANYTLEFEEYKAKAAFQNEEIKINILFWAKNLSISSFFCYFELCAVSAATLKRKIKNNVHKNTKNNEKAASKEFRFES